MKAQKYNRSQITKNAWKLVKKFGANFADAMATAWEVAKGLSSFVTITFTKKNGEMVTRFGTHEQYENSKEATNFKFYDLRAKGVRSAVKVNIHKYLKITVK